MSVLKKLSYLLAAGMAAATLSGAVFAADEMSTEAIAARIAPVGQVYTAKDLEGIATAAAAPAAASSGPRDGETVFKGACFACHDTGAAGRLYFANQFRLAHEAYEAFMASLGFPIGDILKAGRFGLPIVRAEADYKAALSVGDANVGR